MAAKSSETKIWCDEDEHLKYETYADFNDWLDGEEGREVAIKSLGLMAGRASRGLFAGDKDAYEFNLEKYRINQREEWLGKFFLEELCGDSHWSERNAQRFDQLCDFIGEGDVVPFIGAGVSQPGGFPTWKDHLRQQWRTANLSMETVETLLLEGRYESIVDQIEIARGREVFVQELCDAFKGNRTIPESLYIISELFRDTLITTNYDRLIEQSFDIGDESSVEVLTPATILNPPDPKKITLIKLHGDIQTPGRCILSKNEYGRNYGDEGIDLSLPVPQVLDYYFRNNSVLFLGCSLNQDRTIRVFEALKVKAKTDGIDLPPHFSVEQCPETQKELADRNAYLLKLGITPIWFEKGRFEFVEGILRLARNEMRYRRR